MGHNFNNDITQSFVGRGPVIECGLLATCQLGCTPKYFECLCDLFHWLPAAMAPLAAAEIVIGLVYRLGAPERMGLAVQLGSAGFLQEFGDIATGRCDLVGHFKRENDE